tara:strand:+ start:77 stop:193 length:117 start_codon:yes stop_codon:yes gene_type:complete
MTILECEAKAKDAIVMGIITEEQYDAYVQFLFNKHKDD